MENEEEVIVNDSDAIDAINDMLTPVNPPPRTEKSRINGESLEDRVPVARCSKRSSKDQNKNKKDERSLESVKKALNGVSAPEEKLAMLCEKYAELLEENRKLVVTVKQGEKKMGQLQREKEQLQADHSKVVLTRSRLESLCRELQRQNKAVKEESLGRIRDEEEKRKELSARFNVTLNEITALMQQNTEKNNKLRDENKELTDKFKTLCEQYELREKQVEKLFTQNKLESKLSETKMAKAKIEMIEEKELLLRELASYQVQCQEFSSNETALRSQITMYSEKYDEFQQALARSNEVFSSFKNEMDKMSKKICKLEKETTSWKTRWEKSHQALLEMAADKQQRDEELVKAARQMAQLQRLCRTLQEQRTIYMTRLRELGEDIDTSESTTLKKEEEALVKAELPKPGKPGPNIEEMVAPVIEVSPEPEDIKEEEVSEKTETKSKVNNKNNKQNKKTVSNTVQKSSSNNKDLSIKKEEETSPVNGILVDANKSDEIDKTTDQSVTTNVSSVPPKDIKSEAPGDKPATTLVPSDAPIIPSEADKLPTAVETIPVTPKEAVVTAKEAPDTPNKAVVTPKEAPDTPNKAVVTPKEAPDTPNKAAVTPKEAPDTLKEAPDTPKKVPVTPKEAAVIPIDVPVTPDKAQVTAKVTTSEVNGSPIKSLESTEAVKPPSAATTPPANENKKKPKDGGRKKKK